MSGCQPPAVSLDSPDSLSAIRAIPQLKVVYCGEVQEQAPRYCAPHQVAEAMCDDMRTLNREAFYVLHLDGKSRIIAKELISLGSLNQAIVHPREVFKGALLNNAAAIIGVHNHPSGDPAPSREDRDITRRLTECAGLLSVRLLDHVIIGFTDNGMNYYSFAESGLLAGTSSDPAYTSSRSPDTSPSPAVLPERVRPPKCEWLVSLRKQAGLTQKQLAELAGFKCQASISQIELGYMKVDEILEKRLRDAFTENLKK